jgi:hypothetical protein
MMDFDKLSKSEQRAYALFTRMKLIDAKKEVRHIENDLKEMATWGIDIDDMPDYEWIKVYAKGDE